MVKRILSVITLLLYSSSLRAEEAPATCQLLDKEGTGRDAHNVVPNTIGGYHHMPHDEEASCVQAAEKCLQDLNKEIERFLSLKTTCLRENEAFLRKTGKWEEELAQRERFEKKLKKLQEDFVIFRHSLSDVISENHGPCSYSRMLYVSSIAQSTEWYATHLKGWLFPEHWESRDSVRTDSGNK